MTNNVFSKVNECLEKYIGGEVFFDKLDEMVKFDKSILSAFIKEVNTSYNNVRTIASGEFGLCLHNYGLPVDIIVQGGLRKGVQICDLSNFIKEGDSFIFLDDSYFSGKTAQVIKEEVERCKGTFVGCFVVYDGSQHSIHSVSSVYRYYDYYDVLGRKKKDV